MRWPWCSREPELSLVAAARVDAQAIWEWAFIERFSSGLFLMIGGHLDEGRAHLDSAERLVSGVAPDGPPRCARARPANRASAAGWPDALGHSS
jgi:hypothetical protein